MDGNIDAVKVILDNHGNPNQHIDMESIFSETPLILAIRQSHMDMVKLLIDHGAIIDDIDGFSRTALEFAVTSNNLDCTKLLIEKGAM